jgi:Fe-S oxidoreductase
MPRYVKWLWPWQPFIDVGTKIPGSGAILQSMGFDKRRPLPRFKRAWTSRFRAKRLATHATPIVLFADTFNNWMEPGNLAAAARVLQATGHHVIAVVGADGRPLCCGRTYLSAGMLGEARREAKRTMSALKPFIEAGTRIVGLEPSCVFTFRDEYAAMFPGDAEAAGMKGVQLADEYLAAAIAEGKIEPPWKATPAASIRVHGHCHQKAFDTFDATLRLLKTLPGCDVKAIESSCCGMAGSFGHEKGHYDVSMKMGEAALFPAVRAAGESAIAAAGVSCRQQIVDGTGRVARHPLALLAEAL